MTVTDHPAKDTPLGSRAVLAELAFPVLDVDRVTLVEIPSFNPPVCRHDSVVSRESERIALFGR
jgi:hypothetical protein